MMKVCVRVFECVECNHNLRVSRIQIIYLVIYILYYIFYYIFSFLYLISSQIVTNTKKKLLSGKRWKQHSGLFMVATQGAGLRELAEGVATPPAARRCRKWQADEVCLLGRFGIPRFCIGLSNPGHVSPLSSPVLPLFWRSLYRFNSQQDTAFFRFRFERPLVFSFLSWVD